MKNCHPDSNLCSLPLDGGLRVAGWCCPGRFEEFGDDLLIASFVLGPDLMNDRQRRAPFYARNLKMTRKREHCKNKIGRVAQLQVKALTIIAFFFSAATGAQAAECKAVAGMINGQRTTAVRSVQLSPGRIALAGKMAGRPMPRRTLPCKNLAKGVLCEGLFDGVLVSVMTNGKRMIEHVSDPSTRKELAAFAYTCNQVMKP
jgi:hypothetical protein